MLGKMTNADHQAMDEYLKKLYTDTKSGDVSETSFIGGLAQIMAALDQANVGEAVSWFKRHGRGVDH